MKLTIRRWILCLVLILFTAGALPASPDLSPGLSAVTVQAREKTGWHGKGTSRYYVDKSGKKAKGLKKVGSYWYYFGTGGKPKTGVQDIGGGTYYFRPKAGKNRERGAMLTGWLYYKGQHYYFSPKKTSKYKLGQAIKGWNTIKGGRYYFRTSKETKSGKTYPKYSLATGWRDEGNDSYYCDTRKNSKTYGQALTGWQTISGEKFYFYKKTIPGVKGAKIYAAAKGAVTISGKKYYFKTTGGIPRAGALMQAPEVSSLIKRPTYEVLTPEAWIRTNTAAKETMTVNTRNGKKTLTIYKQTYFDNATLRNNGCAISAASVALNLMGASRYASVTPLQAHMTLEKQAFGYMIEGNPLSAFGVQTLLAAFGVDSSYMKTFTEETAAVAIETNLRQGRPVLCWMGKGPDGKWDKFMHTICLVGMTDTGKIIAADSSNRSWAGSRQRLKLVTMDDILPYLIQSPSAGSNPYWTGLSKSCGILLIR